jgi:hypothetical protein
LEAKIGTSHLDLARILKQQAEIKAIRGDLPAEAALTRRAAEIERNALNKPDQPNIV